MLLSQMHWHKNRHKTDRLYQLWQEGSHPQLQNAAMMRQKLDYIPGNPVKRGYVHEAVHWRYSSGRDYAGLTGLCPIVTAWDG